MHIGLPHLSLNPTTATIASAAFLFGVFLAVIHLTERLRSPLEATFIRTVAGVVLGTAIAIVLSASLMLVLGAAVFGGFLGYFGTAWASHV